MNVSVDDLPRRRCATISSAIGLVLIMAGGPSAGRLAADDDWIGKKAEPTLSSSQPSRSLLGSPVNVPGLEGFEIKLDATKVLPQMRFSADGRHAFILEKAGVLRKLTFPAMEQVGELPVKSRCSSLSVSKAGLLIALDGKEELWVVDPDTLAVSKRIEVPLAASATGSAASDIAWARIATQGRTELAAIDLKAGKVVRQATMNGWGQFRKTYPYPSDIHKNLLMELGSAVGLAATADGKHLIVAESNGRLCRYRIERATLIAEEAQWAGPTGGTGDLRFTLSDDSQYVATWQRNREVLKIADFSKPVIKGSEQPWPKHEAFAFDRLGQKLYVGGSDHPTLWTLNTRGQVEKEFYLGRDAGSSLQILVHPDGRGMLVLTERKLYRLGPVTAAAVGTASQPADGGKTLPSQVVAVAGARVTCLTGLAGEGADEPRGGDWTPGWSCWSGDGRAVYWLGKNRRLRRIELAGFKVSAQAEFKHQPKWLSLSASGLMTFVPDAQEMLVLDPATLETRQAIPIPASPGVTGMAASAVLSKVLLHHEDTNQLRWVDLRRGPSQPFGPSAVKGLVQAKWPEQMLRLGTFDGKLQPEHLAKQVSLTQPVLTPDGKHLFTGNGTLFGFRLSGDDLVMIAAVDTASPLGRKVVSPDGRHVSITMTSLPADRIADRLPGVLAWEVVGFPRIAGAVRTVQHSLQLALGQDLKAFAVVRTGMLTVCDIAAGKTHDVKLPEPAWLLDAHPGGRFVLVGGRKDLMFVELEQDGQSPPEDASK